MKFYISMKFHENILNGFSSYRADTKLPLWNFKGELLQTIKIRVMFLVFLCSCCLMILYISTKFHENVLNNFQVMERKRNYHCRISKGINSKTV